jgi:hypothetical protein
MKLNPKLKVEKVVSKVSDTRQYLHQPHLDVANKCLVATNGKILVRIPVEVSPEDTSGPIPLEAIADARTRKMETAEIVSNGDVSLMAPGGELRATYTRPDPTGKYPEYETVIPGADAEPVFSVALNSRLLWELTQALLVTTGRGKGEPVVRLDFTDRNSAVSVRGNTYKEGDPDGVIMPCKF